MYYMQYSAFFFSKLKKNFLFHFKANGGRNFFGRICVFHRGGAHFVNYRFLDFARKLVGWGMLLKIFKDSFRSAFLGTILYFNGITSNSIMAEGVRIGAILISGIFFFKSFFSLANGYTLPLNFLPLFSPLFGVELRPSSGIKYVRSAGTMTFCIASLANHCILKMNSGWQLMVSNNVIASFGKVSNSSHKYISFKKAGQRRALGFRPVVRGVAKNPCDHPHGGGEGKGSPPAAQRSPWGKLAKGTPTNNKLKDRLLRRRFKNLL